MSESDYKNLIRILRLICSHAISIKDNFGLSDSDISPVLRAEEQAEEIITAVYVDEENV